MNFSRCTNCVYIFYNNIRYINIRNLIAVYSNPVVVPIAKNDRLHRDDNVYAEKEK